MAVITEGDDPAELARLPEALERLAKGLEAFLAFGAEDASVRDRSRWEAALDGPFPQEGVGLDGVIEELLEWVVPYGLRTPHPGFSGYIISRPSTAGILAGTAATVAGHVRDFLSSFNHLEDVGLAWLAELFGLPTARSGVFSGGGSTANLLALGAARQAAFEALGIDPAADGLPPSPAARIYGSAEVHHTVHRACGVLGFGRRSFTATATDRTGRADPAALRERIRTDRRQGLLPLAIVAVAGTTGTGSVDDLSAMVDIAAAEGVWLHVDGAYGLLARCVSELEPMFEGVEHADSVIVDPHKWLGTPVGCGATYIRDETLLERAFTQEPAAYLTTFAPEDETSQFDHFGKNWFDRSLEPPRSISRVLGMGVLREIGAEGVRARIRRHIGFATGSHRWSTTTLGSSCFYRRRCRSAASATAARRKTRHSSTA